MNYYFYAAKHLLLFLYWAIFIDEFHPRNTQDFCPRWYIYYVMKYVFGEVLCGILEGIFLSWLGIAYQAKKRDWLTST